MCLVVLALLAVILVSDLFFSTSHVIQYPHGSKRVNANPSEEYYALLSTRLEMDDYTTIPDYGA